MALVTGSSVVVVFIEAELAMCNKTLKLEIELLTEDGQVVAIPGPAGPQAVRLEQSIIVPSPPGVPTGFPGHATAMMELSNGIPLGPGIYRWQACVNARGKTTGRPGSTWPPRFNRQRSVTLRQPLPRRGREDPGNQQFAGDGQEARPLADRAQRMAGTGPHELVATLAPGPGTVARVPGVPAADDVRFGPSHGRARRAG